MNITPLPNQVQGADVPLERLSGNTSLSQEQKIGEASRQFEAVLLRQILSETQKTVFKSNLTDDSAASGIYHDMVTTQLADSISKSGALGLSQTLQHQLNHVAKKTSAGHDPSAGALPTASAVTDVARPPHSDRKVARVVRKGLNNLENLNIAH